MKKITRTVYGNAVQTHLLLDKPFVLVPRTTLNEKFSILQDAQPGQNEMPTLGYMAIGDQGHTVVMGPNNRPYTAPVSHASTDAACFNHLPFVLREVDRDLSTNERRNYGLRRQEVHNGVTYYAYYLKRITIAASDPIDMMYNSVNDGVTTQRRFTPTTDNLNPTPVLPENTQSVTTNGDYLSVSSLLDIGFSTRDVENLKEVADILYGLEDLAIVSEIALCTGIDRNTTGQSGDGSAINYTEVIACQVAMFLSTYYPVVHTQDGFSLQLNVGKTEPLFSIAEEG